MCCLQCGLEAEVKEQFNGTDIQVCPIGHRTGITTEPALERIEPDENLWIEKAS